MEQNIYSLCRNVGLQVENFLQRELSDLNLTPAQANLLLVILNDYPQGTTVTELHEKMGTAKSSLSSLIKPLKQKGYLRTENHQADERVKVLLPTEKLWQTREKLQAAEYHLRAVLRKAVEEEKLVEICETLQRFCRNEEAENKKGVGV